MANKHKHNSLFFINTLFIVIAFFIVFQLYGQYDRLLDMQDEIAVYTQRLEVAEAEYQQLLETRELLNNDSYIERLARENLGMVKQGETLVSLSKDTGAPTLNEHLDVKALNH